MSNDFEKNNLSKSAPNSMSDNNDDISDNSSNEENYENETFEEDSQDDEDSVDFSLDTLEQFRNAQKQRAFPNKTFTSTQIREIERENTILMNKILAYSRKPTRPKVTASSKLHMTSSAINRKKNQMKIDWENQVLLRKIQTVKPSIKY